ncbi:uncharacterized, partial [Tachysurus ichikawai]
MELVLSKSPTSAGFYTEQRSTLRTEQAVEEELRLPAP